MRNRTHGSVKALLRQLVVAAAILAVPAAQGAVSLSHTRLIISAKQPEATPRVTNEGSQPVLLQLWIDTGERAADPQHLAVPFVVVPPVLRLEPGGTQRLRVMYTGRAAPSTDQESVYWLNILEIPPKAGSPRTDLLQISFRTRVKLFFRPAGMPATRLDAHEALRFEFRPHGQGGTLRITNPTPVHQTLLELVLGAGRTDAAAQRLTPPDMLRPHESVDVPVARRQPEQMLGARVFYSVINDLGVVVEGAGSLGEAAGSK